MKFLILTSIFLSYTALANIKGEWLVEGSRCSKDYIEKVCGNVPTKVRISYVNSHRLNFTTIYDHNSSTTEMSLYGIRSIEENNSYSIFWYTDTQLHFETVEFKNWNLTNTWVMGEIYGYSNDLMYLEIGGYKEVPLRVRESMTLYLHR
ncbi:MAG: hypothetical protein CME67_01675 [Halobacteriovoraceae bacterium]|nr:hypothetical protein [Halobacteriovoraceae bacterium]